MIGSWVFEEGKGIGISLGHEGCFLVNFLDVEDVLSGVGEMMMGLRVMAVYFDDELGNFL